MKKMLSALAILTGLLITTCAPPAFAVAMPECATQQGDTDEDTLKLFAGKWPNDTLYLLYGDEMDVAVAAATFVLEVNAAPPADATELWISSGPGGDGSTVFVLFADDCYLGAFNMTQEQFEEIMDMAFPDGNPEPIRKPGNPASHQPMVIPLEGARSA